MNLDKYKIDKCLELINFSSNDNIFVTFGKVLPHGFNQISNFLGFTSCNHVTDIFHNLVNQLEPVVYFIISLF